MSTFLHKTLVRPIEIAVITVVAIWVFWNELSPSAERFSSGEPGLIFAAIFSGKQS